LLDSDAITKIQSIILIAIIAVAAVATYVLWDGPSQSSETIKIGVLADLDAYGKPDWQGALLAVEEINAEGGILGRQVELIGEDHDGGVFSGILTTALTKAITQDQVDFIVGLAAGSTGFVVQDIIAQHKIIFLSTGSGPEEVTQRILDDYDTFKYYFCTTFNQTCGKLTLTNSLISLREITGFNKVGYLAESLDWNEDQREALDAFLPENGFELVYKGTFPFSTVDFSSYFAAAEAAGVEMMIPMIALDKGIPFCNEYYDRQSPMLVSGVNIAASDSRGWEWTEGKCNHMAFAADPTSAGYPYTSKTVQTKEAYMNRWGEPITRSATIYYDATKFILKDAIERAGTIETEAVIKALEETSVETSNARDFVFTEAHSMMMGTNPNDPDAEYYMEMIFQWQDGELIPVYPEKIRLEAGASYTFPDWSGPWDDLD